MAATQTQSTTTAPALYLAFDLGWTEWKLAFSTAPAEPARVRTIAARDLAALAQEIADSEEFPRCVAANVATSFLGRPLTVDDQPLHEELSTTFVDGQLRLRALVRAIVKSEAYRLANDRLNVEEQ